MGNITGEGFKPHVADQIKQRQKQLGDTSRSTSQLLQQNANSAWIKLTSAIVIKYPDKFRYKDPDIAKRYSLFGGTLKDGTVLGGLDSYTAFGYEQGPRPAPGIVFFETKNRNRGSIRESTINIKAYSREQFELLDILYLRLGYSVFIEFGNSLYYDNEGNYTAFKDSDTLTSKFLDNTYTGDQAKLLIDIEQKKINTSANYDAIFGRISNFTWSFLPDGSYDITVVIMSYGDVIESLKMNVMPEDSPSGILTQEQKKQEAQAKADQQAKLADAKTDYEVIDILKNISVLGRLFYDIRQDLIKTTTNGTFRCRSLATANPFRFKGGVYKKYDAIKIFNAESNEIYFYIRFGALLQYMWDTNMIYVNLNAQNPLITLDNDPETNLIYKTPYTVSANPQICVVRTPVELLNAAGGEIFPQIPDEGIFQDPTHKDAGRLMNVYVNMAYVLKEINGLKDNNNKVPIFDLLKSICNGIQSSLGAQNKLEPTIDAEEGRFYIVEEVVIPSRQPKPSTSGIIKLYGLNPDKEGSFVRDFGIKTEITNELASTITIGAQANGYIKGEDATAFSKWNRGLDDRILPIKTNKGETQADRDAKAAKQAQLGQAYLSIQQEYLNYIQGLVDYTWDEEKVSEFSSILTNMITFAQSATAVNTDTATGILGFLPINLNMTIDGISGIKIYQQFAVDSSFLPYNYGSTLQFLIRGIAHRIQDNQWTTSIDTVVVPNSVVVLSSSQDFGGVKASAGPTGTSGPAAAPTGVVVYPSNTPGPVRLKLRRLKEVTTPGSQTIGQTLGTLELFDNAGKKLKDFTTVELLWKGNNSSISCIPPGRYPFTKSKANNNPGLGSVFRLGDVPYRGGILIHAGSSYKDSNGCILPGIVAQGDKTGDKVPDNKSTKDAMRELLDAIYPAGAPNNTYIIEVYGIKDKKYIEERTGAEYANPSSLPASDPGTASRSTYIQYARLLNDVLLLKDGFDNLRPLLKATKGTLNDNEAEAVARMRGLINENITPAVWKNKLDLSKLTPYHKKLFREQFTALMNAIVSKVGAKSFPFKFPSTTDQTKYGKDRIIMNVDY
jgi:hypothetical protein